MANADVNGSRFIVTGVDSPPGGPKELLGIDRAMMRDAATYQQLLGDNIEPAIDLKYFPHEFDGKVLGVFEISGCKEQPYQMRKDYTPLRRGEMWIRKGTRQMLLPREDILRMETQRRASSGFSGDVDVQFRHAGTWPGPEMRVMPRRFELPTEKAEREIKEVLAARAAAHTGAGWMPRFRDPFSFVPYYERTTEELNELIKTIRKDLEDYDLAALYGEHAEAVNFRLVNKGDEFLEDVRFEVMIPRVPGVLLSNALYEEPIYLNGTQLNNFRLAGGYPDIKFSRNYAIVSHNVGNLRHQVATPAFDEAVRLCFREQSAGLTLDLKWTLHGKNLRRPLSGALMIVVGEKVAEVLDRE